MSIINAAMAKKLSDKHNSSFEDTVAKAYNLIRESCLLGKYQISLSLEEDILTNFMNHMIEKGYEVYSIDSNLFSPLPKNFVEIIISWKTPRPSGWRD